MNYNADFGDLRSIFNYANENIEQLHKIEFLCGYQSPIADITNRIRQCLRDKSYLDFDNKPDAQHHDKLRRIVFYLMLNTDVTFAAPHDLEDDMAIVHVLQNIPQLTDFLLLYLVWSLRLHQFFGEAIAITPHWFAVEFVAAAVESLDASTVPDLNRASRAEPLVVAMFQNLVRSGEAAANEARSVEAAANEARFGNVWMELVREFLTATEERLLTLAKPKRAKMLGYVMRYSLSAAQRCIELFEDTDKALAAPNASADTIFGILDANSASQPLTPSTAATRDRLLRLIFGLLNAIQTSAMQINLDLFLVWADWDLDDEFTMQRHIGESVHRLLQLLNGNPLLKHDVVTQLNPIAVCPKTLANVVAESQLGEIICKLDSLDIDPAIRAMWLGEFVARGILVWDNDECMDTLEGNIEHLQLEHVARIIHDVKALHFVLGDSCDRMRKVILAAAGRMKPAEVLELINRSVEFNPPDGVDLELDSFSANIIGLFNRCSPQLLRETSTMALILQNPARFVDHALETALKSDKQQTEIGDFLDTLPAAIVRPFVQRTLATLLGRCEMLPAGDRSRMSTLLARLHDTQFAEPAAFLQFFYGLVCAKSREGRTLTVLCMMHALQLVLQRRLVPTGSGEAFTAMSAPLLVMCAALMDSYRWDIVTYLEEREQIVTVAVEIMHELRKRFLPVASDKERAFVVGKVAGFNLYTRFYFQRFALHRDQQPVDFGTFICPNVYGDASAERKLEVLLGMMVRSTHKECAMLAQNTTLRPYWFLAVALMGRVVSRSESNENSWACLRYVAQSLAHVVRNNLQAAATDAHRKWLLISDYVKLIRKLEPLPMYEDLFMDAHYVILELLANISSAVIAAPAVNDGDTDAGDTSTVAQAKFERQREVFRQAVALLRDCPARMLVLQALA